MATDLILTNLMDTGLVGRLFLVLGLAIGYAICLVLYHLYFHPLAKIPGPRIAGKWCNSFHRFPSAIHQAVTDWYRISDYCTICNVP